MTQTPNYNLNIVEGSDVVNPLVQTNPNFVEIDTVMKANEGRGVATATEVKSGTNHAITRNVANAVFRFVATSDFRTDDTFSVDGNTVTVSLASGENPKDRAFVVGTSVLCILESTRLTLVGCESEINLVANNVLFDNSDTDISATNVENAIKEINAKFTKESVSIEADGIKTFQELLYNLSDLIDWNKITNNTKLLIDSVIFTLAAKGSQLRFSCIESGNASYVRVSVIRIASLSNIFYNTVQIGSNTSVSNNTNDVATAGTTITIIY